MVTVEKLFHNLPVRRRELERNIKREWHKVISLLNQYACIQTNLKFSVSQQPTKGKRIVLFSTKGNDSTRDNIINIFGAKTMTPLVPLDLRLEIRPSVLEPGMKALVEPRSGSTEVRVVGHVSRPVGGEGRQTPDRQMFFVNGRPCGLPQFAKTFNEVYRSYNSTQSPFIFADIQLDTIMYDVNVSPDKRTILLHDQTRLLETLRTSLLSLFDSHEYTVPVSRPLDRQTSLKSTISQVSTPKKGTISPKDVTKLPPTSTSYIGKDKLGAAADPSNEQEGEDEDEDEENNDEEEKPLAPPRSLRRNTSRSLRENGADQRLITPWTRRKASPSPAPSNRSLSPESTDASRAAQGTVDAAPATMPLLYSAQNVGKSLPVQDFNSRIAEFSAAKSLNGRTVSPPLPLVDSSDSEESLIPAVKVTTIMPSQSDIGLQTRRSSRKHASEVTSIIIGDRPLTSTLVTPLSKRRKTVEAEDGQPHGENSGVVDSLDDNDESLTEANQPLGETRALAGEKFSPEPRVRQIVQLGPPSTPMRNRRVAESQETDEDHPTEETPSHAGTTIQTQLAEPRALSFQSGHRRKEATLQLVQKLHIDEHHISEQMVSRHESISREDSRNLGVDEVEDIDANDAETKLALIISRSDFARMRVAGQFNLGFIIATRPSRRAEGSEGSGDDELFIIDQHASDEKYNFERLQDTTTVQSQPLVHHKRLELTALEEEIIMQNQSAIEANGFKFDMDLSGDSPVGSRCRLTALPLSRETTFDITDFEELLALLGDESSESSHVPRPSKVRKMFAMRACRSSIMIGKPLTKSQMYTLVKHMGEMDKPWNCPHGRPTMRHLCRLQAWNSKSWKGDVEKMTASAWQSYGNGI